MRHTLGMGTNVLIMVQNLSVPFDRRVWQECQSLRGAGFSVTVVCPIGVERDTAPFENCEGIQIHRFPLRAATGGVVGYVREYTASLIQMRTLVRRLSRDQRFDVVHAANPPDFLLLLARPLKRRDGARFIFDHHDLAPELYLSRFGRSKGMLYRALRRLEHVSYSLADVVIATNDSYREVALTRGRKAPGDVFVVRNGPDLGEFESVEPDPTLRRGKHALIAFVGMMGAQDGVDYALRALARLRSRRSDWHALFVGDGDTRLAMMNLAAGLGLDSVEFSGMVDRPTVAKVLATADICLAPEPWNPLNAKSTMVKVAEYMAARRPIVAFDLHETRATAADAALYAQPNDEEAFADRISILLDDDSLRERLGETGRARVEQHFSWRSSEQQLLAAYGRALGDDSSTAPQPRPAEARA